MQASLFRRFRSEDSQHADAGGSGGSGAQGGGQSGQSGGSGGGGSSYGTGTGGGGTSAAGTAGAGAGQSGATGGAGGSSPVSISDDTLVQFPGMAQPMRWSDYQRHYAQTYQQRFLDNLRNLSQRLPQRGQPAGQPAYGQGQPAAGGQRQQPPIDLKQLRNIGLLDGETAAELIETGVLPLHQYVQSMGQYVQALTQQVQQLQKGHGSIAERFTRQEFDDLVTTAISKELGEGYDPKDGLLRELAETLYLSYDPNDQNLPREFPALFKKLITDVEKWVRARDQKRLQEAKSRPRKFLRAGGSGQPGGPSRTPFETPQQIAARLFEQPGDAT